MDARGGRDARSFNRRRWPRVRIAVPIHVSKPAGKDGAMSQHIVQSADLSTGGAYVTTAEKGIFVPGEMLRVSVSVPWEARYLFPFSRLVGSCRVVRVDDGSRSGHDGQAAALAFSEEGMLRLGSVVFP